MKRVVSMILSAVIAAGTCFSAFAFTGDQFAGDNTVTLDKTEIAQGDKTLIILTPQTITEGATLTVEENEYTDLEIKVENIHDVNDFLTLGEEIVSGGKTYVTAEAVKTGATRIKATFKLYGTLNGETVAIPGMEEVVMSEFIDITAEEVIPPEEISAEEAQAAVDAAVNQSTVIIDLDALGKTRISAAAYNVLKQANKESIQFVSKNYKWIFYRGDYTKLNIDYSFDLNVSFGVSAEMHNLVLDTLGNDKADPYYIHVAENKKIPASKPELIVKVKAEWMEVNSHRDLSVYLFEHKADSAVCDHTKDEIKKVSSGLVVKSLQDKNLSLEISKGGQYFLLNGKTSVGNNNNSNNNNSNNNNNTDKPNPGTGAADVTSAMIAFSIIALAAVGGSVVKKISK